MLVIFAIQVVAIAECPIPLDGSLFVRVERGHLIIDTSAQDSVTVEVSDSGVQVEEQCFDDHVEINGVVPARIYGRPLDWRITVPASVNLDLRTFAGSIRVSPTDGNVTARTAGGSVIAGDIGGSTAMITQGGSILVGNIGGNAELRSTGGGQIEIGDVSGNAELATIAGPITTGTVSGRVSAETNGGTITIEESLGQLEAMTLAGNILIGTSGLTRVQTAGGNIVADLVHGPFVGSTDLGNIRIGHAESYIEAAAGTGDIDASLSPSSLDGDLHVSLTTNSGNIRLLIPEDLAADVDANIQRTASRAPSIISSFPMDTVGSRPNLPAGLTNSFSTSTNVHRRAKLNGGGNVIELETSRGTIEIRQTGR
jgi:DUF4097 and DUF4098 domain-containing protein YvlB